TAKRRTHGTPAATATARSRARKDLQHLGSPPMIPTACSDHSPVTSQRWSSARSARREAGSRRATGSSPSPCCGLGVGSWRGGTRLQEQLLVDLPGLALGSICEQLAGHVHEGAQV